MTTQVFLGFYFFFFFFDGMSLQIGVVTKLRKTYFFKILILSMNYFYSGQTC
jgi:hypothetical protein